MSAAASDYSLSGERLPIVRKGSAASLSSLKQVFAEIDAASISVRQAEGTVSSPFARRSASPLPSGPNDAGDPRGKLARAYSRTLRQLKKATEIEPSPFADAKPSLPQNPKIAAQLVRQCERGVEFLRCLTEKSQYSRIAPSMDPMMPKTALRASKGIAFMWQRKAGLLASWSWGAGFVIAHLGPGQWSAPCFLNDRFLSLGLTAGFRTLASCYAIANEEGMAAFKLDAFKSSIDVALTLGYDPFEGDAPVKVYTHGERLAAELGHKPAIKPLQTYRVSDGSIIDLSWRIGMHCVDDKRNAVLYGAGMNASEILEGAVQPPEEFLPLYAVIAELAGSKLVRQTTSQCEAAIERCKVNSMLVNKGSFLRRSSINSSGGNASGASASSTAPRTDRTSMEGGSTAGSSSVPTAPTSAGSSFKLFGDVLLELDLNDDQQHESPRGQSLLTTISERCTAERVLRNLDSKLLERD